MHKLTQTYCVLVSFLGKSGLASCPQYSSAFDPKQSFLKGQA